MPEPIPVIILGRLAVERGHQRCGLGRMLFRDAARRVLNAADAIGIRCILASATSGQARAFATALGFEPSPLEPMALMVTLADLRAGQTP